MVEDVLTDHEVVLSIKCVCEYVCVCGHKRMERDIGRTPSQDETKRCDESGEKAMDEMPSTGGWSTWSGQV